MPRFDKASIAMGQRWSGTPPKEYAGQSRYGPCSFYYFPDTYTWLVRCRNKFRNSVDQPLVIGHPDGRDFYNDTDVMQALGHPDITPILTHGVVAPPSKGKYPGYHKMRQKIEMELYACHIFQRAPLQVGDRLTADRYSHPLSQEHIDCALAFAKPHLFETDGNWMWVAWHDKAPTSEPCGSDGGTINYGVTAGYTGFYKAKPVITRDPGFIRVDCAHNPSFWAEMHCDYYEE